MSKKKIDHNFGRGPVSAYFTFHDLYDVRELLIKEHHALHKHYIHLLDFHEIYEKSKEDKDISAQVDKLRTELINCSLGGNIINKGIAKSIEALLYLIRDKEFVYE